MFLGLAYFTQHGVAYAGFPSFLRLNNIRVCVRARAPMHMCTHVYTAFSPPSTIVGPLGGVPILATVSNAAVNMPLWDPAFIYFG